MKPSHYLISTFLLLYATVQIDGQIEITTCGRLYAKNVTPFVANGFNSNHHWPWHAAIYHPIDKLDLMYQCGGTLISTRSVLTAAHCVSADDAELDVHLVTVALGRLNLARNESTAQWFGVSEILRHPEYNSTNFANDIAIITLSTHAIFNYYVQPICLWKSDKTDLLEVVGKTGTVIGWGITENGAVSNILQEAHFPVVDFYTCVKSDLLFFGSIVTQKSFCAGNRNGSMKRTGLCQGDSGGSIAFEENGIYYIRGITSVGQRKRNPITQELQCDSMQYAVFTDVAQFLPWIIEKATVEPTLLISRLPIAVNVGADFSICGQLSPRATPQVTYDTNHWPWHAAIYHDIDDNGPTYQCGGTVISSKAILTAAHCVQIDANKIFVNLGRLNLGANENSAQAFGVAKIIAHPEYERESYANDIAIMKLSTDAIFNRYVRPVCLWKSSNTDLSEIVGKLGTIVGWGRTETGKLATVLRESTVPVVSQIACFKSNVDIFAKFLTETNFCAGYRNNGTGVCFSGTGGSMTFERDGFYYIRGIGSFEPSKFDRENDKVTCDPTQFTIYTDVAKYLQWIKDNQ